MSGHETAPGLGDLLWPTLNFVLFVVLLVRVLREPLREFFRARTVRLREALLAGAQARREAEEVRAALEADLRSLPARCDQLRADIRAAADRQRQTIVELGREGAERIRADARLLAEQELEAARQALRMEVVEEAIRQAIGLIRGTVRAEDQERFVQDFVRGAGSPA